MTYTNRRSIKGLVYGTYLRLAGRTRIRRYYEQTLEEGVGEMLAGGFTVRARHGYNWNLLPRDSDSVLVDVCAGVEKLLHLEALPGLSPLVFVVGEAARVRVLVDINHPGQVHLFKHAARAWMARGDACCSSRATRMSPSRCSRIRAAL